MRLIFVLSLSVFIFLASATTWACNKKHTAKHSAKHATKHHAKTLKKTAQKKAKAASKIARQQRHKKEQAKRFIASVRQKKTERLPPKYISTKESQDELLVKSGAITQREPSSEELNIADEPMPEINLYENPQPEEDL